jgi:predicted transcriptional regulator
LKDFSTHQNQKSSFVELRRGFAASRQGDARVGIGKRETKTAETSSTYRVMSRIPGPSVILVGIDEIQEISSVMSRDVQLIKPDDTIRSAAALMKKIDAGYCR